MIRKISIIALTALTTLGARAQESQISSLYSGAYFLSIAPDARAGALGSIGASTSADPYSIFWNAAKSAFTENKAELSYTYSPWMRDLIKDINLSSIGFSYKLDDMQTISAGFRYFSFGDVMFIGEDGMNMGEQNPYEMSIDIAYARKLGQYLSAGVTLKYIRSELGMGQMVGNVKADPANAVAADISLFFNKNVNFLTENAVWRAGLTLANIGSKLKYGGDNESYLPGDLRLGTSYELNFNNQHALMIALEADALMTPRYKNNEKPDKSGVGGYFSSFGDIQSDNIMWALAAEYWYAKTVALRAGYHHGNSDNGHPTWFSTGVGLRYYNLLADFSYVAGISDNNPMKNSLQFSIGVNFDIFKKKAQ